MLMTLHMMGTDPAYDGDRPCIIKLAARLWLLAAPLPPGIKKAANHLPITVLKR